MNEQKLTLLDVALQLVDETDPAHVADRDALLREAADALRDRELDRAYTAMQRLARLTCRRGNDDAA